MSDFEKAAGELLGSVARGVMGAQDETIETLRRERDEALQEVGVRIRERDAYRDRLTDSEKARDVLHNSMAAAEARAERLAGAIRRGIAAFDDGTLTGEQRAASDEMFAALSDAPARTVAPDALCDRCRAEGCPHHTTPVTPPASPRPLHYADCAHDSTAEISVPHMDEPCGFVSEVNHVACTLPFGHAGWHRNPPVVPAPAPPVAPVKGTT